MICIFDVSAWGEFVIYFYRLLVPPPAAGAVCVCVYILERNYIKFYNFLERLYLKGSWSGPKLYGPVWQRRLTDELVLVSFLFIFFRVSVKSASFFFFVFPFAC